MDRPITADSVTLRDAGLDDVDAVVALVESAYRGEPSRAGWTTEADLLAGRRTDAADVTRQLTAEGSLMLLAVSAQAGLVGCAHLTRRDPETAYFGMFAVRPVRQGGGIGGRLLAAAEERARTEWGSTQLFMTVIGQRGELVDWYRRRGYTPTGQTAPWPHDGTAFGVPRRGDIYFRTLAKSLDGAGSA